MLREIDRDAIQPALMLLPMAMSWPPTVCMLLAIGLQESGLTHRAQMGGGPARGIGQFERDGGVRSVLTHPTTCAIARSVCETRGHEPDAQHAWAALEHDDVLAAAFMRLLLWTDPHRLPADPDGAWLMYLRCWRPGRPRPEHWASNWKRAEDWVLRGIDS